MPAWRSVKDVDGAFPSEKPRSRSIYPVARAMLQRVPPMTLRGVRLAPAFFALFLFAETARAQSITIPTEASLPRVKSDGAAATKRSLTLEPEGVSLQDCIDDIRIRFTLVLAGFEPQATLQVW